MKICACVAQKTSKKCIEVIEKLNTDLIEHRIDFMGEIEGLEKIYTASKFPVIATNRSSSSGGYYTGTEKSRIASLIDAINAGCTMIDIELKTQNEMKEELIKHAKKNNCGVIISQHDFERTPTTIKLHNIMKMEQSQGADIGKIVTTAHSIEDCHRVLSLLLKAKKENFPLVAFTMGETGRFTRVIGSLYGAPFTYTFAGDRVAPGQLRAATLRAVHEVIL